MNLLHENIQNINFSDVADFCRQRIIEGVYLDYKEEKPKKLAKQIAAFSNTLGGLIIIGIQEDKSTGCPKAWNGITNDGKIIDSIHQLASEVIPLPTYEVAATDEVNGKVFILIRILEGSAAPYVTQSDPTVWIRTGNISTPLRPSNREDLLMLTGKSRFAKQLRDLREGMITKHFNGLIQGQEVIRHRDGGSGKLREEQLISHVKTTLMPFHPLRFLYNPRDYATVQASRELIGGGDNSLASLAGEANSIPNGFGAIRYHRLEGDIYALQFYADGSLRYTEDIGKVDARGRVIYVGDIFSNALKTIHAATAIYKRTKYQGMIRGSIALENARSAQVVRMEGPRGDFAKRLQPVLDDYEWEIDTDTSVLSDDKARMDYLVKLCEQIHWDLGDEGPGEQVIQDFIIKSRLWRLESNAG